MDTYSKNKAYREYPNRLDRASAIAMLELAKDYYVTALGDINEIVESYLSDYREISATVINTDERKAKLTQGVKDYYTERLNNVENVLNNHIGAIAEKSRDTPIEVRNLIKNALPNFHEVDLVIGSVVDNLFSQK